MPKSEADAVCLTVRKLEALVRPVCSIPNSAGKDVVTKSKSLLQTQDQYLLISEEWTLVAYQRAYSFNNPITEMLSMFI